MTNVPILGSTARALLDASGQNRTGLVGPPLVARATIICRPGDTPFGLYASYNPDGFLFTFLTSIHRKHVV